MLPSDIFLFVLKDAQYKLIVVYETALFVATNYFKEKRRVKQFRNVLSPSGTYSLPDQACSNDNFGSVNSIARFQDL
jgi:uncharacterized membrane protein (UPF0127 family)